MQERGGRVMRIIQHLQEKVNDVLKSTKSLYNNCTNHRGNWRRGLYYRQ